MITKEFLDAQEEMQPYIPYIDIMEERRRQDNTWGQQRHSWGWWLAILGEEYGEVCKEALENHFDKKDNLYDLREELVQLAAVTVAIIEHVDEKIKEQAVDE